MKINCALIKPLKFILALVTMGVIGCQNNSPLDYAKLKQQFIEIKAAATTKSPLNKFYTYLRFYNSIDEDPEKIVTFDILEELIKVEKNLIFLDVNGHAYLPENIIHCYEVDSQAKVVSGNELDTTMMLSDTNQGYYFKSESLPGSGTASLKIIPGYGAKIIKVFAGDGGELQSGKPPSPVVLRDNKFLVNELNKWRYPVLIVIYSCNDKLRLRKCVWHLKKQKTLKNAK